MNAYRLILSTFCMMAVLQLAAQNRSQREMADLYNAVEDQSEVRTGENIDEKIRKNFFLTAEVSKQRCFAGENIMAVFKAYSRLDANSQVLKRPSLSGFSVTEMVDAYSNQPDVEKYNGNYYYVHLIRKVQLFPILAGDYEIEPAEVESVIHLRSAGDGKKGMRLHNLFRKRDTDPALQRQLVFRSPVVNVHVDPLPIESQPEDFTGAVGEFSVRLVVEDSAVALHEPVIIKLLVGGSGNFPLITDPKITWPIGVQVSGPSVSEQVNKYEFPLSGMKTFEYPVANNKPGVFTIPPVKFSFFDPSSKSYKTAETLPVSYTVAETESKSNIQQNIVTKAPPAPLHYYYFGAIAIIIAGVIIFLAVKKPAKKS